MQLVATVYLDGAEALRVIAPEKVTGSPLDWIPQLHVRQISKEMFGGDEIVQDGRSHSIIPACSGRVAEACHSWLRNLCVLDGL